MYELLLAAIIVFCQAQSFVCDYSLQTQGTTTSGTLKYDWSTGRMLFRQADATSFYQFNITHGYPSTAHTGFLSFSGSMEGDLGFPPGSWVLGGYHYKNTILPGPTYTFQNAQLVLPVSCVHGSTVANGQIVIPLNNGPYTSGVSDWFPWRDQASVNPLPWQGAVQAPDLCNGGRMYNKVGATFSATVVSKSSTPITVQFHYRVPAAKNSPNTNCMDASNPNSYVASICQASESSSPSVTPIVPVNQTAYIWDTYTGACNSQNFTGAQPALFSASAFWASSPTGLSASALGSLSGASTLTLSGSFPQVYTTNTGAVYTFSNCASAVFSDSDFYVADPCPPLMA